MEWEKRMEAEAKLAEIAAMKKMAGEEINTKKGGAEDQLQVQAQLKQRKNRHYL